MAAYVLLVTWFAYGQPPSSYQTVFDSEHACGLARSAVLAEAEQMADEVRVAVAAAARRGAVVPASASPPKVSAVCTPKGN